MSIERYDLMQVAAGNAGIMKINAAGGNVLRIYKVYIPNIWRDPDRWYRFFTGR